MDDVAQSFAAFVAGITSAAITGKSAFTLTTGLMSYCSDDSGRFSRLKDVAEQEEEDLKGGDVRQKSTDCATCGLAT